MTDSPASSRCGCCSPALALAVLSLHAIRKERAASSALDAIDRPSATAPRTRRRAAEARSLELAETSPDVVAVLGPDGAITYVLAGLPRASSATSPTS